MKIIEEKYNWKGSLKPRKSTKYIILHHRAGDGDVKSIHQAHIKNGWSGIGYHFYVRKDGSVYEGRPIDTVGAHCTGYNSESVGVCFEGNFQSEGMLSEQLSSGRKLIAQLKTIYPTAEIKKHEELSQTVCPGRKFPFDEIKKTRNNLVSPNDITWELSQKIKIEDVDGFVSALDSAKQENSPLYWGFYKIVNG